MRSTFWIGIAVFFLAPTVEAKAAGEVTPSSLRQNIPVLEESTAENIDAPPLNQQELIELSAKVGTFEGNQVPIRRNVTLLVDKATPQAKHTSKLLVGKKGKAIPVQTVLFDSGRVDALLPEQYAERGILLQSNRIQGLSTQGRIAMVATPDHVAVAALEGKALVGRGGNFRLLREGRVRIFNLSSGKFADSDKLMAPSVESRALNMALVGGQEAKLRSTRVAGATSYRASVIDSRGKSVGVPTEGSDPENLKAFVPRAGTYWVTVRAVDKFGIGGAPSKPIPISVLGISNGAELVRHGIIFLAPGQKAQLVGQEGLVIRYGTSPEFVPAPSYINLPGRRTTTVEFRDPNDTERFAVFRLSPRVLKSSLQLGPPGSTWPHDPTKMSVRMWDGRGAPLAWMDDYQVVVKVNLNVKEVTWTRSEGQLIAELPPETGPGPWVVRLSVLDPTGIEIARNMLEVIHDPPPKPMNTADGSAPLPAKARRARSRQ